MAAANPNRGRPREREAIRAAIIDAARRVAAREGIGAVSLSRVANEANFATGVVYGHFRSKNELLLSMVANDLSTMAHEMRETGWPDDGETGAQAALPLEEPVHEQIPNAIAEVAEEPVPQEDVEPFAGNAGLTAVARALQLPDEEITAAQEQHEETAPDEEIFSEPSFAEEPFAEEAVEPTEEAQPVIEEEVLEHQPVEIAPETEIVLEAVPEISFEAIAPVIEHTEEISASQHEAVLPEDDMDPFGNGLAHKELAARKAVFPEDDMDPFADAAPAGERPSFGKAKSVLPEEDLNPFVSAPVETPDAPIANETVAETQFAPAAEETVEEPLIETIEETPTLADDGEQTPDAGELAIQNMPAVQKKRQERTQLNDIINRLVMPDAPSAKGTSGSLARLDRRMSVFEKALADM